MSGVNPGGSSGPRCQDPHLPSKARAVLPLHRYKEGRGRQMTRYPSWRVSAPAEPSTCRAPNGFSNMLIQKGSKERLSCGAAARRLPPSRLGQRSEELTPDPRLRSRQPLAGAAMILDAGRIVWVGPMTQLQAPAGPQTVDLTGKYGMPGLLNLHA